MTFLITALGLLISVVSCGRIVPEGFVLSEVAVGNSNRNGRGFSALANLNCPADLSVRVTGDGIDPPPVFRFAEAYSDPSVLSSAAADTEVLGASPIDVLIKKGYPRRLWIFGAAYTNGSSGCGSGPTNAYPVKGVTKNLMIDKAFAIDLGAVVSLSKFQVFSSDSASEALQLGAETGEKFKVIKIDWDTDLSAISGNTMTVEAKEPLTGLVFKSAAYSVYTDFTSTLTFGPLPQNWTYDLKFTWNNAGTDKCLHVRDFKVAPDTITGSHVQTEAVSSGGFSTAACSANVGAS